MTVPEDPATPSDPTAGQISDSEGASAGSFDLFAVALPGFQGSLADLVQRAQRGEVDLATIPVAEITGRVRCHLASCDPSAHDPRDVADFLTLAARLLSLKARHLLPDGRVEPPEPDGDEEGPADDPGARLAEYRLFKAAAEALLAPAAEEGVRAFLGMVAPEVTPVERLAIPPERLAAAFRAVLERLPSAESLQVRVTTYSVEEKVAWLRRVVEERRRLAFDAVFETVSSRLEAVAVFLALLELVRLGEVCVEQDGPFGGITVRVAS